MANNTPAFWRNVKKDDIITLTDTQTIEELMEQKSDDITKGIDFTVIRVFQFKDNQGLIEFRFFEIQTGDYTWHLLAKMVDEIVELRVYCVPEEFENGDRDKVVADGNQWIFQEPKNVDDFEVNTLEYTRNFDNTDSEGNVTEFEIQDQGEIYGEFMDLSNKDEPTFAALVEYSTESKCDNPYALILEIGGMNVPEQENEDDEVEPQFVGGFVMFMEGCKINFTDVEVMN